MHDQGCSPREVRRQENTTTTMDAPPLREQVSKIMVVHTVGQNHKHMARLLILIVSEKPSCGSIYVKREKKQKQL